MDDTVDYHSFLPDSGHGMTQRPQIHEVPNPAPVPVVVGPDLQVGQAVQEPMLDPDYYHRNSKAVPSKTIVESNNRSGRDRNVPDDSEEDSHINRRRGRDRHRDHRHHHHHRGRSNSLHRSHSVDVQSALTAYRKIEPISAPADRIGL
jgi:hypothetical protein